MKTPRQILLERHQAAEPALDRLRNDVLASLPSPNANESYWRLVIRELFIVSRWKWSALALVWLCIALLHFWVDGRSSSTTGSLPSAEWLAQEDALLAQSFETEKLSRSPL